MYFFDSETRPTLDRSPGISAQTMWGENMLLSYVTLQPNATICTHHHPEEQISVILRGEVTITIGGETRTLKSGDIYVVPGNVEHTGFAGQDGALLVDVFSPIRKELQV